MTMDAFSLLDWLAHHHHTTVESILSPSRKKEPTAARQQACWALHTAGWSYSSVGTLLNRDHTTVMHAVKAIDPAPGWLAALAADVESQPDVTCRRCRTRLRIALANIADAAPLCKPCQREILDMCAGLAELMDPETIAALRASVDRYDVDPGRLLREAVAMWARRRVAAPTCRSCTNPAHPGHADCRSCLGIGLRRAS